MEDEVAVEANGDDGDTEIEKASEEGDSADDRDEHEEEHDDDDDENDRSYSDVHGPLRVLEGGFLLDPSPVGNDHHCEEADSTIPPM